MQTICRLIPLSPNDAASLVANPASLSQRVGSAKDYSDVYRYWHAIEYLLAQHRPGSAAANWLTMGATVSAAAVDIPGARVLSDTFDMRDLGDLDQDFLLAGGQRDPRTASVDRGAHLRQRLFDTDPVGTEMDL